MTRPVGSKNIQIPDPPFVLEFGSQIKVILTPKQVKYEVADDGSDECDWSFDGQLEINGKLDEKANFEMSLEDLEDLETLVKVATRWTTKMDREKEKLESQLEELQKKLSFLQR
jgi:hypothetical protein